MVSRTDRRRSALPAQAFKAGSMERVLQLQGYRVKVVPVLGGADLKHVAKAVSDGARGRGKVACVARFQGIDLLAVSDGPKHLQTPQALEASYHQESEKKRAASEASAEVGIRALQSKEARSA